jgi:histidine ammonia-lyase
MSTNWMEIRKVQQPSRRFGTAPTAALVALRNVVPLHPGTGPAAATRAVYTLMQTTPASQFYQGGPAAPTGDKRPLAQSLPDK